MTCLIQFKYSIKKSYTIITSINIALSLFSYSIYLFKGMEYLDHIFPLVVSLPNLICFLFLSKSQPSKVLFSFLTVSNFGMFKSMIGLIALDISKSFAISLFFETLCFIIIVIIMLKIFRKPYFKISNSLYKGWAIFCSVPLLLSVIIYILLYYLTPNNRTAEYITVLILVFALMFISYAIVYLNFENISQFYLLKQNENIILIQTEMQKKEFDAIQEKIYITQLYRHDIRHHINALNTFLQDKNILEAQKYLSKLTLNFDNTIVEQYCENYVINAILSTYVKKAKDENIAVTCQVDISKDISINDIELGLIFSNAIENATIACKKIEDSNERMINITCKEHYSQLYIQISNTYIGEILFNKEMPISKETNHGYGTLSIASIADKYNGVYSFTAEDGIFKVAVIFNND